MTHSGGPPVSFRAVSSRLVALLACRLGAAHLDTAEDAVQTALVRALELWPRQGAPEKPEAWLFRVAENHAISMLRSEARRARLARTHVAALSGAPAAVDPGGTGTGGPALRGEVADATLRTLLACCDPRLPLETQLVFALKTLCGLSVSEVAAHLFATQAATYKRYARAKAVLKARGRLDVAPAHYAARVPGVCAVLYALFTAGHLRADDVVRPGADTSPTEAPADQVHTDQVHAVRHALCDDALRLVRVLAGHPVGRGPAHGPTVHALGALMLLHRARLDARVDAAGGVVRLDAQDRARWDRRMIHEGLTWLQRAASGPHYTRYHGEAAIAAVHCMAPSFEATPWDEIVAHYARLAAHAPAPGHSVGHALALAERDGPRAGLAHFAHIAADAPAWLTRSAVWAAAHADLHRRAGHGEKARAYTAKALARAPAGPVRDALAQRLNPGLNPAP